MQQATQNRRQETGITGDMIAIIRKTTMKKILAVAIALLSIGAQAATVMGSTNCVQWTKESKSVVKLEHELHVMWLLGYVSSANVHSQTDFLAGNQSQALVMWVNNYCASNPLDDASTAAENLIKALVSRR